MKIIVSGDRNWSNEERMFKYLDNLDRLHGPLHIIQGGARGADTMAGQWVRSRGRSGTRMNAKWKRYGRAAGPIRNRKMLKEEPDMVVAFHDDITNSRGTKDMLKAAQEAGVMTVLVTSSGVHPGADPDNFHQLSLDM